MVNDYEENHGFGWISLYRSIQNHWVFENEKYFKWWVIMLFEVNHTNKKTTRYYDVYDIGRGQSCNCLRTWGNLFNTTPKTVSKFFKLLEKDKMITREKIGKSKQALTLITINNYNDYQTQSKQGLPQGVNKKETRSKQGLPTNNKYNKENKEIKEDKKMIFFSWLEYRKEIKKPIKAKSTIESLIKKFNAEDLNKCKWVVNNSIENNYQGLFWDNYKANKQTNKPDRPVF